MTLTTVSTTLLYCDVSCRMERQHVNRIPDFNVTSLFKPNISETVRDRDTVTVDLHALLERVTSNDLE